MQNLDFAALNKAANSEAWCDTFAYWLGMLYKPQSLFAQNAREAYYAMSFQFDVEEQAQNEEMLIGDAEIIPSVFRPVAPVTVALEWSPFPLAVERLGQPLHLDTHQGHALAVFKPVAIHNTTAYSIDEKHFLFLLTQVCNLALADGAFVLLIGSPGWTYEEMDSYIKLADVRKLMQDFGFVYTLRKPVAA